MSPRNTPIKTSIKIGLGGNGRSHGNNRSPGNGRGVDSGSFTPKVFKKEAAKKRKMILPYRPPTTGVKEVPLDLFKENRSEFKVIGEFPGLNKVDDLVIQVDENEIFVVTKPIETERSYFGSCELPEAWMTTIGQKVLNNGVMTVVLRNKGEGQRDAGNF